VVEQRIADSSLNGIEDENDQAMQFNRDFANKRHGVIGLVKEYIKSALRPTVAYPYPILLLVVLLGG
jgi:hypothetical protein